MAKVTQTRTKANIVGKIAVLCMFGLFLVSHQGCAVSRTRFDEAPVVETQTETVKTEKSIEFGFQRSQPKNLNVVLSNVETVKITDKTIIKSNWRKDANPITAMYSVEYFQNNSDVGLSLVIAGAFSIAYDIYGYVADPFVALPDIFNEKKYVAGHIAGAFAAYVIPFAAVISGWEDKKGEIVNTETNITSSKTREEKRKKRTNSDYTLTVLGKSIQRTTDSEGRDEYFLGYHYLEAIAKGQDKLVVTAKYGSVSKTITIGLEPMLSLVSKATPEYLKPYVSAKNIDQKDISFLFWSMVRDRAAMKAPALAQAASKQLKNYDVSTKAYDTQTVQLLAQGKGKATFADGTTVDWTPGKPSRAPRAQANLVIEGGTEVTAGSDMRFVISVRNTGKGDLFQVAARSSSDFTLANKINVLFGRVPAGKTVTRTITIPTERTMTQPEVVTVFKFTEANEYSPEALTVKARIRPAPSPRLALFLRTIDDGSGDSVGNGDGIVQLREAIDVKVVVRNLGKMTSVNTQLKIDIKKQSGIDIFGDLVRKLGNIEPGEAREETISVALKPSFKGKSIPILAFVREDSIFKKSKREDLTLVVDKSPPRKITVINRPVYVTTTSLLLNGADSDSRSLGQAPKGTKLQAVGELSDYIKVRFQGSGKSAKNAWIARKDVTFEADKVDPASIRSGTIIQIAKIPPVIALSNLEENGALNTGAKSVKIKATLKDLDSTLESARVLCNGKEILALMANGKVVKAENTRGFSGTATAKPIKKAKNGGIKILKIDHELPLEVGENKFVIEAIDSDGEVAKVLTSVIRSKVEGQVYALVVGINKYKDSKIGTLKYAESDAKSVGDFLKTHPMSPVKNPKNVKVLLGAGATLTAIKEQLESHLIRKAVRPEDTVLFYFAGHGYSDNDKFYLTGQDTKVGSLRATALARRDLQNYWTDIRAKTKVFIADACHSGGLTGLRGENNVHKGLMSVKGKKESGSGSLTLVAAGPKQLSVESKKLGHGVFTYALLEGLKGKADKELGDRDGRVSAGELVKYLNREVPALATSTRASAKQNPTHEILGAKGEIFLTK